MDKQWRASWIMDRQFDGLEPMDVFHKEMTPTTLPEHRQELVNHHTLFRKTLHLASVPSNASIDITADDYYKLYINGQFVGQGPAQGNHYHYYYNRFDITSYLRQGDNVIGVHVYYHGLISRSYNSGDYRQGMIAELTVDDVHAAGTDATWTYKRAEQYGAADVIGYHTQFLENIDSSLKDAGWSNAGFIETGWLPAWVHAADDHRLFLPPTPPLSVYRVRPHSIVAIEGGFLLDFGSELTGQITLRASGARGQQIEIRCGEELLPDGRVRYDMRCNCLYRDTWILSGEAEDEPEFYDYKAFRYAEVLADPEAAVDPDSFAAIVRHYPLDDRALEMTSSNTLLNAIWDICKNGVKYGTQENYVDCPSREKGQYLGDNTIITHAHAYISGDLRMFRKALEDFAWLSERTCPGLMAVAPGHFMQEIADYSLQFPLQLLQYYRFSGDRPFLASMYAAAERMMDHFGQYSREDGLLDTVDDKWNLVDWPANLRDGYDFGLDKKVSQGCHNVINAFYYGAMLAMEDIRRELGIGEQTDDNARLSRFRQSFIAVFYDPERGLFTDAEGSTHASLHANALPLLFKLAPEEAIAPIVGLIRRKRLSCGVYMAYFVLQALAEAREHELLYELIVSEDTHSWSTMVKEGATTCFEAWSKELKWNTSLCHPWASAPIPMLIEAVFGIRPAEPGWTAVAFSPRIPASLQNVRLRFRTPAGGISFTSDKGATTLSVPEGVTLHTD